MSFLSPIFGYLDVNSFGKFVALVLSNPRHWNLDESIAGGARFLDHRHLTSSLLPPWESLPFLHARMDRRRLNAVTRTSQFTSDKNPEAGLNVSSLEFVAGGLSVSGGV